MIVHTEWDIITPDPRSNQVIHRRMYNIEWTKTPAFWKIANNMANQAMELSVELLAAFFLNSSVRYLAGEPYEGATRVGRAYPCWINQFLEDDEGE